MAPIDFDTRGFTRISCAKVQPVSREETHRFRCFGFAICLMRHILPRAQRSEFRYFGEFFVFVFVFVFFFLYSSKQLNEMYYVQLSIQTRVMQSGESTILDFVSLGREKGNLGLQNAEICSRKPWKCDTGLISFAGKAILCRRSYLSYLSEHPL